MSQFQREFESQIKESRTDKNWLFTEIAGRYQVSTCYRASSAPEGSHFYETFVFDKGEPLGSRHNWIGDETGRRSHWEVVESIIKLGRYEEASDE